jgi:hypothetical protein
VLIDAARPKATPAPLPAMKPLVGHPGVFKALGSHGPILARRIPRAWVVVSGGQSEQQRLSVLRQLYAVNRL